MPHPVAEGPGLVGRALGEFVVREPLSSGGFGAVYRAEQPALAREAVIKVLHQRLLGRETMVQRFLREARLASRLDHPYAAHIYAFGAEPDGLLWIAMELVRGIPLDRMLREHGPIALDRFVPLLERICEVVHSAHEQGIIHRDLKPANVMVLERSGRLLPKLLDFGIAKLSAGEGLDPTITPPSVEATAPIDKRARLARGDETQPISGSDTVPMGRPITGSGSGGPVGHLTEVGTTVGSPIYMAPEQWTDAAATDVRTDIYALGILCHEALTGQPPFRGDTSIELAMAHASAPVPSLGRSFPPALDDVLARALAKRADDRFGSALELAAAFRTASGVEREPIPLPRIDSALRAAAMLGLPRPLALAVDAFDAARNAHQGRDACWQLVRTAVHTVAVVALAAHGHVQDPGGVDGIEEPLRRLRERRPPDAAWLAVARALVAPFATMREAHPVGGLVELLARPSCALDELVQLRAESRDAAGGSEEQVIDLIETAMPLIVRLLEDLSFLYHHPLAVPLERGVAEDWVGVRRDRRTRRIPASVPTGRPVLLDEDGEIAVMLWPFVQVLAPAPGAPPALFLFDGKGRRGARLVALPDSFEHEDEELWEAFGALLGDTAESAAEETDREVCPFPGLAAFSGADAASFVGRERETEAVVNRLRVQPLLTVAGPSGAGKSSFVQAGVLPALPDGWTSIAVRPGPAPLVSLAARFEGEGVDPRGDPAEFAVALRILAERRGCTLVLFVDQLEELFTLCQDAGERARFAELLGRAARSPDDPVRVILTVRDDFLLRLESLPALRDRLGPGLQLLTTPAEPDLRRILTEPLRRAGYEFDDPALPDRVVAEVVGRPGALALLSFTAARLWDLRDRRFRHVTAGAYQSIAGVGGALAKHAEDTLVAMHPEQQRLVREVFRHAVTAEGTRAVLTRSELTEVLGASAHAGHVIEKLLAARLLVVSDDERGGERIEVTHEALLEAWPRLVTWRREDAEGARLRDQLRAAARQWTERGKPSGLLWRGDALDEYRIWRRRVPGGLTAAEEAFAAASLADAARGRRLRAALITLAFVALAGFAIALLVQNARVGRERERANSKAGEMHDLLRDEYEEQGRRLLLGDEPRLALAYLHRASQLGVTGPAHDFLLAQAIRATDGQLLALDQDGSVNAVRFSPDGERVVTGGLDNRARLWDARRGLRLADLPHQGEVRAVEWSPSGDRIATGGVDGAALWDRDGKLVHRLATGFVVVLRFTPDGGRLVTTTANDEVALWDAGQGTRIALLRAGDPESGPPVDGKLAVSRDWIAAGDRAGVIHLWDGRSQREVGSWKAHGDQVLWIAFSPDGTRLASSGNGDQAAAVWSLPDHRRLLSLAHTGIVNAVTFSPDGERIATASADRTAALWSSDKGERLFTLGGHTTGLWRASWSPDGALVATCGDDGSVLLWNVQEGRRVGRLFGHRAPVHDLSFDPKGRWLASAGSDHRALVWTTEPQQRIIFLRGHVLASAWSIEFSPGGDHVLTASADKTARIWDASTGRELLTLRHPSHLAIARFSPDGLRVATGADDGAVRIWDSASGALLDTLTGHKQPVGALGWDRGGAELVSGATDGTVRVWSIATGKPLLDLAAHDGKAVVFAAFHPSRPNVIVTIGVDDSTVVWDEATGHPLSRIEGHSRRRGSFDRSGAWLVNATVNRSAEIWRLDGGGASGRELLGHMGWVRTARFSPDDAFVVTASNDESARIWDRERGRLLAILPHTDSWVNDAVFSPDGKRVATVRGDGVGEIWQLPSRAGRSLDEVVKCRAPYDIQGHSLVLRELPIDPCIAR